MSGDFKMEQKLEKMTDESLAKRMSNYIAQIKSIQVRAEYYSLGQCPQKEADELSADYNKIRRKIQDDALFLNCNKDKAGSKLLWDKYFPSISEASAWGLYAEIENGLNDEFIQSLKEAEKRLTKYYSYDYWRIIAEE